MKKIFTAINHPIINQYLNDNHPELDVYKEDFEQQDMLFAYLKKQVPNVLILSENLPGPFDKFALIEKLIKIEPSFRIIMIISKKDKEYSQFLSSKGVNDILLNDHAEIIDLVEAIKKDSQSISRYRSELPKEVRQELRTLKKLLSEKPRVIEKQIILEAPPKIQRQEVIVLSGVSSVGKSDLITQLSTTLSKRSKAKILVVDLNTEFPSLDLFFGVPKEPSSIDYYIGAEKNSCLNYMIDNIDKGRLDCNIFEELVIKQKNPENLHILTGNYSLYLCQHVLNNNYYKTILDMAKSLYDFIFIDTSSNIFLDSTQFAVTNATKIFFVVEGTYANLRKSLQVLTLYVKSWGISKEKIKIIVNKFSAHSLEKEVIKEILSEYEVIETIDFDSSHDLCLNKNIPFAQKASEKHLEKYINILSRFNYVEKKSFFQKLFKTKTKLFDENEIQYFENQQKSGGIQC